MMRSYGTLILIGNIYLILCAKVKALDSGVGVAMIKDNTPTLAPLSEDLLRQWRL